MSDVQVLTGPVLVYILGSNIPGSVLTKTSAPFDMLSPSNIALTVTRTGDVDVWFRWCLAQGHASDLVDPVATIFYKFTFIQVQGVI